MDSLGNRLKKLRGDATSETVAKGIGIPASTYRSYEADIRTPRDEVKVKICNYFLVPIQDLFYPENCADSKHLCAMESEEQRHDG